MNLLGPYIYKELLFLVEHTRVGIKIILPEITIANIPNVRVYASSGMSNKAHK